MKNYLMAAALALLPASGIAQPIEGSAAAEGAARQFVTAARQALPHDLGDGIRIVDMRQEGPVAVFVLDLPAALIAVSELDPEGAEAAMVEGFCRDPSNTAAIFAAGIVVGFEIRREGRPPMRWRNVASCSAG